MGGTVVAVTSSQASVASTLAGIAKQLATFYLFKGTQSKLQARPRRARCGA
jgi:hypothetical protein